MSLIRILSCIPQTIPISPNNNSINIENILEVIKSKYNLIDIIHFPKHSICGTECGSIAFSRAMINACNLALDRIIKCSLSMPDVLIILDLPIVNNYQNVYQTMLIQNGVCNIALDNTVFLFNNSDISFMVSHADSQTIKSMPSELFKNADVILFSGEISAQCGNYDRALRFMSSVSDYASVGAVLTNASSTNTTTPYMYQGFSIMAEGGCIALEQKQIDFNTSICVFDFDVDIIRSEKNGISSCLNRVTVNHALTEKSDIIRYISTDPFLADVPLDKINARLEELFTFQQMALAGRLSHIGVKKMVLGISGGLDSTLAILVCAGVADILNLSRENIIAVTMPGFGTSNKTYNNAYALMSKLGVTIKEISIRNAVVNHLSDIDHDINKYDVTFENAQARERTQILLDIANQNGAIMVGTGDLSEIALGFCTFGGDHLSMFSVNACVTKTMIRKLIAYIASECPKFKVVAEPLISILDTPISPELLPPDEFDNISQKTEDILGPYIVHDFFLYHFMKYGFEKQKLFEYACTAFRDQFDNGSIGKWLDTFLRRFSQSQFKRACSPEFSRITKINFGCENFTMPSDGGTEIYMI